MYSIAGSMAQELGIPQQNFSIKNRSGVPKNLKNSILGSGGLVKIELSKDQADLLNFNNDGLLDHTIKIKFDEFKKKLENQDNKLKREWEDLPKYFKTWKLYRQLVGDPDDLQDLLTIYKQKLGPSCHRRTLGGLLDGISKNAQEKLAKLADDPDYDYVKRLTTKVHKAFQA
jgi:hypothetical protein